MFQPDCMASVIDDPFRGRFRQHSYAQLLRPVAPKRVRIQSSVSIFLRFWDLRAQKLLVVMKLTPAVNFINILHVRFSYEILAPKIKR